MKRTGLIKKFNLLKEGSGIRFTITPSKKGRGKFLLAGFLLAILILFITSSVLFYSRDKRVAEVAVLMNLIKEKIDPWVDYLAGLLRQIERPQKERAGAGRVGIPSGALSAKEDNILTTTGRIPEPAGMAGKETFCIRYALFIKKENAISYHNLLAESGIKAYVRTAKSLLPSYTIQVGPFWDYWSRERAYRELKKLGVAQIRLNEQRYLVGGPVWVRNEALEIRKRLEPMSPNVRIMMRQKPRRVYKVVSDVYDSRVLARRRLDKLKSLKIKPVIERGE